jgi:hypothetical protein
MPKLSRRTLLVGVLSTPALTGPVAAVAPDPTILICQRWLALKAESEKLLTAWSEHESWLARHHDWYRLSDVERSALPEARKLVQIHAQLDTLDQESEALLETLPTTPATSMAAVIANLTVAAGLLCDEDHPEVRGLIVRSVRDLASLR